MSRRRRREPQDALDAAILHARRLWDAFLGACTERDRCHLACDVAGAHVATATIQNLDEMLTVAEASVQRLDAATAHVRGPRARARSRRVHHTEQPLGGGVETPRPTLTVERGEERSP
jgi:hypothetical protein